MRELMAELRSSRSCERRAQRDRVQAGKIDKLTHENAILKRLKFAAKRRPSTPSRRACWRRRWTADLAAWPPRSSSCSR
jgi:hypothetical protein